LKYRRDIILADTLALQLARAWSVYGLPAGHVVPVPLAAEREHERGYNQSALLARALAELAGLPYEPRGLRRVRHTHSQVGLSGDERHHNVRGAFQARPERVAGRSIVLVDDICTTGATLSACAVALCAAGAAQVWGLTLGRAAAYHGP
jgi:ComF family protein